MVPPLCHLASHAPQVLRLPHVITKTRRIRLDQPKLAALQAWHAVTGNAAPLLVINMVVLHVVQRVHLTRHPLVIITLAVIIVIAVRVYTSSTSGIMALNSIV